jgi:hypothetical protein
MELTVLNREIIVACFEQNLHGFNTNNSKSWLKYRA